MADGKHADIVGKVMCAYVSYKEIPQFCSVDLRAAQPP